MNLDQFLQKVSFGPMSELAIAGEGSGTIPSKHLPKFIVRTNNALTALYTRFPLQSRTIMIETRSGLWAYPLRREFALSSGSAEPNKFIIDNPAQPFLGDLLMVEGVSDHENFALPFNESNNEESWHKVSYDTISNAQVRDMERFFVRYRACHPEISLTEPDLEMEIRIPPTLESALLAHVAGNMYANMDMQGALMKAQAHLANFENECSFHEERNTFAQWEAPGRPDKHHFRDNGWV